MDAVDQLMIIFKQQACAANDAATAQRVLRERAQAERVIEDERQANEAPEPVQAQATVSPIFELEEPNDIPALPQGIPQITQDEYDNYNTPPPHLTHNSNEKHKPSRRTSCSNAWRYQDTRPPSPHDRWHQENFPSNFYVTWHMQFLMTKQVTSLSTII